MNVGIGILGIIGFILVSCLFSAVIYADDLIDDIREKKNNGKNGTFRKRQSENDEKVTKENIT